MVRPNIILPVMGNVSTNTPNRGIIDPTLFSIGFDDFIAGTEAGVMGWTATNSGAGSAPTSAASGSEAFNKAQGAALLSTGTTNTGRSAIHLGQVMGIGYTTISQQWRVWIPTLSTTGVEQFNFMVGFGDTPAGAGIGQTNGLYFTYDLAVSANWLTTTIKAGAPTQTTSAIAVTNAGFAKLRIDINSAGTSASFYVNDVLAATHTTNIPGFVQFVGPLTKISKSVGTTARTAIIDYWWQYVAWSTAR